LAFGGLLLLLLGGRLGDMIGQVRAFRTGLVLFVLASLLGGLAETPNMLVAARVLQGMGAALAGPSVLALVMVMSRDARKQARGMSLFIAVSTIGASAGLVLGGVLTEYLSWRWSLLVNVPVGALVVGFVGRLVAETHPKTARLDVIGAVTATFGSVALVYGFIRAAEAGWAYSGTLWSFASGAALFVIFVRVERKHREPLLDLRLLQDRTRLGALVVMALIVGMHFSVLFMLVRYLQQVSNEHGDYFPAVFLPLIVHAVGIALVFAPGTVAILRGVPNEHAGAASGLLRMDQQLRGALGIAAIAALNALAAIPGLAVSGSL
jgi:MFS family permease